MLKHSFDLKKIETKQLTPRTTGGVVSTVTPTDSSAVAILALLIAVTLTL